MAKYTVSNKSFLIVLIMFIGLFVHTYVIKTPIGFNLRPYLISVFIFIVFKSFYPKIAYPKLLIAALPFFIYWVLQSFYLLIFKLDHFSEHIITSVIIIIFFISIYAAIGDMKLFKTGFKNIYKAITLIFLVGVILYFVALMKYGVTGFWEMRLQGVDKMEQLNSIKNIVHADQGFIPRFAGFHISPNFWAGFSLFAFYILKTTRLIAQDYTNLYKYALTLVLISLVITFSRGTFIAILIGIAFYRWKSIKTKILHLKVKRLFWIIFIFLGIIAFLYFFIDFERFLVVLRNKINFENFMKNPRFRIWEYHIAYTKNHLFLGEGVSRSMEVFVPTINPPREAASHNTYINIINYFGLIGFLLFAFFIIIVAFELRRKYTITSLKIYRFGNSMLIGLLIYIFFEHAFIKIFFWGILYLIVQIASLNFSNKLNPIDNTRQ